MQVFPNATYYKRQGYPLKKIVQYAKAREFTDVVVINEDRKQINGMLVTHLPDGPTALFRITNLKLSEDIEVRRWLFLMLVLLSLKGGAER